MWKQGIVIVMIKRSMIKLQTSRHSRSKDEAIGMKSITDFLHKNGEVIHINREIRAWATARVLPVQIKTHEAIFS